jgi:hypothetical protein
MGSRTNALVDKCVRLCQQFRQVADCYLGDLYPLTPYSLENTAWMGWQFDRPDLGTGMVQVFRRSEIIDHTEGLGISISTDDGRTWSEVRKLYDWGRYHAWYPSSQATSTVLLPDGSILTAFGTGYRCRDIVKGQPAPRDVGLVRWRLNSGALNTETKLRDAPFDSDLRNVFDPSHD